ncbi:MAG: hypothetical protein CFE23_11830 [Flavobacterium sp. BFFFF1]|uniref:McrB family protein n=1 Tax=Flavobacterium sp. BFFFF1 TaxID=2015557 RepID=UPI000BDACD91|nr:AAA family ATPase [Flavobacterium sp. BFFFF1]OYU79938.1 MAG: hypothetical protein CFE23_11830 [Flavobacterium sp. BFFFF1]
MKYERGGKLINFLEISFKGGVDDPKEKEFHKRLASYFNVSLSSKDHGIKFYPDQNTIFENLNDYITVFRSYALDILEEYDFKNKYIITEVAFQKDLKKILSLKNIKTTAKTEPEKKENTLAPMILNQILYGPPGTGKTFNTINKAIAIVESSDEKELANMHRKDLKKKFDDYLITDWESPKGQIAFITFHQSMSYEDFIEGIKPEMKGKELNYDIAEGIFKSICSVAKSNWLDAKAAKNVVSFDAAFSEFVEEWEDNKNMSFKMKTEGKDFTIIGFTKSSIQFRKSNGSTGHTLSINSLRDYFYDNRVLNLTGVGIYYPPILEKLKGYKVSEQSDKRQKNYVLIIDEINRGNVSQIFGELITLIEESKRLGQDEALEVTLPYSKDVFGVPPNLYIIGTMNTADRSIEALDTALRRRFSFTELLPEPKLISPSAMVCRLFWEHKDDDWGSKKYKPKETELFSFLGVSDTMEAEKEGIWETMKKDKIISDLTYFDKYEFTGYNLEAILSTINKRIEVLSDRDHTIGHSYFINITTETALKATFKNCIVPLLQEYFYNDYEKIGWVLGEGFFEEVKHNKEIAVFTKFFNTAKPEVIAQYRFKDFETLDIYEAIQILLGAKKQVQINVPNEGE